MGQRTLRHRDEFWRRLYDRERREYRGGDRRAVAIDDAYVAAQAPVIRERLKAAAVRLAAILNAALVPGS